MSQDGFTLPDCIIREGGAIETLALAALIVAGLTFLACSRWSRIRRCWYVPFGLFLLAEREAEHGLPWVEAEVLTLSHWQMHVFNLNMLGNALLLAAAIWAAYTLARHGLADFVTAMRHRARWLILLLIGGCLGLLAQFIEETVGTTSLGLVAEEGLELIFALCLLAAVIQSIHHLDRERRHWVSRLPLDA
ncbi:hypothetical protein MLD63_07805 [Paracoccus sp. TK19116]|uniref:Uncharacterized protein n=1 Tax=Paracoccus albicereus TaxID=2922394 RepID=A0ABT1MS09_9RHOB|nr:hypothetical protein [Paracoccus albicereus]MCQ0970326.1 hypothetical protein [Paracoccus albicereus]